MTISELVIALNGKSGSERSIPIALSLAESQSWVVRLLTLVEANHDVITAQLYLRGIQARLAVDHPDLCCQITVEVEPHAAEGLSRYSDPGRLMVMATSARIAPHANYIGSAAEAVVRNSQYPALLVGPRCQWNDEVSIERVVVPVDGSQLAEQAVPLAVSWASRLSVPVWVVTAIDPRDTSFAKLPRSQVAAAETNYVHRLADQFQQQAQVHWEVLHNKPANALTEFADATTLTVMSTHGRTGLERVIVGSVTSRFVRNALGPVLVQRVHPDEIGSEKQ